MIVYKEVDSAFFELYDRIPMLVDVKSAYALEKLDNGLGGVIFREIPVPESVKDLGKFTKATEYADSFDITNWAFFMAFDGERPVGAATVASDTQNVNMLDGRSDLSVLWDLRVDGEYKRRGIGASLFRMAAEWSGARGFRQMKIECQNNNVPACKFYRKQGAVLGKIDEYAYYNDIEVRDEVEFIWYLDLHRD